LWCSQSGNDPLEDLAKFGYKLNLKVRIIEYPFTFLATYLNHAYKSHKFSKFLIQILAIKNLQKAALFNFDTAFLVIYVCTYSQPKKGLVAYIGNRFFDVSDKTGCERITPGSRRLFDDAQFPITAQNWGLKLAEGQF
jgi:hypothetical protein